MFICNFSLAHGLKLMPPVSLYYILNNCIKITLRDYSSFKLLGNMELLILIFKQVSKHHAIKFHRLSLEWSDLFIKFRVR